MRNPLVLFGLSLFLTACSTDASKPQAKSSALPQPNSQFVGDSKNPAAKYLELVGFRTREKGAGKLEITFGVVNHSEADLGDLAMNVDLRTVAAKPADPPVCSFSVKVPALGPEEMKEVTALVPTRLRVYELPDWQFLRPQFQITEPR